MTTEPFTILAVDDEETMVRILRRTLSGAGFAVETCNEANAGLTRLQEGGIDLLITDLMMPKVDGFALLEAAKAADPETIVIVITAFSSVESAVKAMKLGAVDYLVKPFDIDTLVMRIKHALEMAQKRSSK